VIPVIPISSSLVSSPLTPFDAKLVNYIPALQKDSKRVWPFRERNLAQPGTLYLDALRNDTRLYSEAGYECKQHTFSKFDFVADAGFGKAKGALFFTGQYSMPPVCPTKKSDIGAAV
jgi:hypothetical protein